MTNTIQVGDKFKRTDDMRYKDNGEDGIHHIVSIVEVTKVEGVQASWKTIEILEETGKPSWNPNSMETTGGFNITMFEKYPSKRLVKL